MAKVAPSSPNGLNCAFFNPDPWPVQNLLSRAMMAYRMRWKRRRLLFRCWRARHQLCCVQDNYKKDTEQGILCFISMRNELDRLPRFLDHYRKLGVTHFFVVDNSSDDGSLKYLAGQKDISIWSTPFSYKGSRFGMDWLGWLLQRYGHDRWCLTVDADELLVFPGSQSDQLPDLIERLEKNKQATLSALMLDLYPKNEIGDIQDVFDIRKMWFDAKGYRAQRQVKAENHWIQGGVRERFFFQDDPAKSPTLNKVPLVKWNRRYVYVTSTHILLPAYLNSGFDCRRHEKITGVLLHTKFEPQILAKTKEELLRKQHFENSELYQTYYETILEAPQLWSTESVQYKGPDQLVDLNLMRNGPGIEADLQ